MKRSTLILLAVFIVLVLVVLVSDNPFRGKEEVAGPPLFPGFDSSAVAVVEVMTPGDTTRMHKVGEIWRVETAADYPADAVAVTEMLSRVRAFDRTEVASRNPEKRSIYQVDGSMVETRLVDADENVLAHVFIGKNGPDFSSAYVRAEGSDEVILARGYLRSVFDKGTRGWRDRTIFDFDAGQALRFTTIRGDTVITAWTEDKIRWTVTEPDSFEAKMNVVDQLLRTLSTLRADDFDPDISLEDAGLDPPWGSVSVHLEDGTDHLLLVGAEEGGKRWVKRADRDMVFQVTKYRLEALFHSPEGLRAPLPEEEATPESSES